MLPALVKMKLKSSAQRITCTFLSDMLGASSLVSLVYENYMYVIDSISNRELVSDDISKSNV